MPWRLLRFPHAFLARLETLGCAVLHGPEIAAGECGAERIDANYRDVLPDGRLRQALARLNLDLSPEALEHAWHELPRVDAPSPAVSGGVQARRAG